MPAFPPSLRARLLLIVAVALLPGAGLALYNAVEQQREAATQIVGEARQNARAFAAELERRIVEARRFARIVAHLPAVSALDSAACRRAVSLVAEGFDLYANVLVATPDGRAFCSAVPLSAPVQLADRPYFLEAVTRRVPIVSDYLVGRVTKRPLIVIADPVVDVSGVVRAVVVIGLDLGWINRLLAQATVPTGSTVTLIDRTGVILAHHPDPERWIGKGLPEKNLREQIRRSQEDLVEMPGFDEHPRLFAIAPLGGLPEARTGSVIVGIPKDSAFAAIGRRRARSLAVLGLVGLMAALMAWMVAGRSIRRPVDAILRIAARLRAGEPNVRLGPPYARGELGQLARAFDDTAAALETREEALREARDTLQAVIDNAALAIVAYDVDGHVTLWNPGAARMFGWSAEEALHRPPLFVPDDRRAEFCQKLERALHGEVFPATEFTRLTRDGRLIDVIAAVAPLRDADGHTRGTVAIHRDITGQKRLEAQHRLVLAALEASANAVVITDRDGRITWVNPAFSCLTGWSTEDALGQTPRLLKSGLQAASVYAELWATILAGRAWHGEIVNRRRDGSLYTEEMTITPVPDEHGEVTHFIAVKQDVTARRQAEDALRRTERLVEMGTLLAGVAHELNNPLAVVLGQAQLLRHAAGDGPLATRADKIRQAAERCARIVRNFLALARQRPPERQEVRLDQVVREAVELLAYPLRVGDIEVTLSLADELPPLWADPQQLHQVVVNLVTNAYTAMQEASPPRRLTLATRYDPGPPRLTLEVADTGPGIPPGVQQRIFEPFFTTKSVGQGTGLGLSLCQGIVETHGGSIRVESRPGHGTRFVVELPVTPPPQAGQTTDDSATEPHSTPSQTILVVDDESEVADLLAEILTAAGHRVDTAANGRLALDKLQTRAYDLILTDLRMPEVDGPTFYRELQRRDPQLCRRVIFLTGDTLGPHIEEFLNEAGRPCLNKPFDQEEIRRAIRQALAA